MKKYDASTRVEEFSSMGLAPSLLPILESERFLRPTSIQSEAIPVAISGQDLIAVSQTGSGKTLAYILTLLSQFEKDPSARALVLSPSRETTEQVFHAFAPFVQPSGISICLLVSGTLEKVQLSQLKKNPRIIVGTPGRVAEHVERNKLLLKGLTRLVIDEADRMLDLGFESQLKFIHGTLRGEWQTLMFAASFGKWAEPVAELLMKTEPVLIRSEGAETPVESLTQKVFFLTQTQKNNRLLDELRALKTGVIIFADSKESCVAIGRLLGHHEFSSDFVHGDMNPGHRNRVLREFREKKIQILVTTDLLARGLDVSHVDHIVNYELPYKSEDFLHRIGRTARAGRNGSAITFVTPGDGRSYRKIKKYLQGATETTLVSKFQFTEDR